MPAFPLHMRVRRVDPPRPDADAQDTLAADAMVVLSLHMNGARIQRMEVHGYDGREHRDDDPRMPALLQPESCFRAWLGMARAIAGSELYPDSVRTFCGAVSDAAHEIAERITAEHDLATQKVEHIPGAPEWVHKCGDTIGVEMVDAWGEELGLDLRARIESLPLGLQLEWQAYLTGFQQRAGNLLARKLSGVERHRISPALANRIADVVRTEIRRERSKGKHPALEVTT